jgi:hypothetical protein
MKSHVAVVVFGLLGFGAVVLILYYLLLIAGLENWLGPTTHDVR